MNAMKSSLNALALVAGLALCAPGAWAEPKGQDFPGTKCTCKSCGKNSKGDKVDVTGQCDTVCKDKTVYSKGSEPYDYCKAAARTKPMTDVHQATKPALQREARPEPQP